MTTTTSPTTIGGIIDWAEDLSMWLAEAEKAVKSAREVASEVALQLTELENRLLEAGEPAALVGAAQREAASVFSDFPDDSIFAYAVKDAGEVKELARLAAEQLAKDGNDA